MVADKVGPPGLITAGNPVVVHHHHHQRGALDGDRCSCVRPDTHGRHVRAERRPARRAFPCSLGTLAPGETRIITTTFNVPPGYTMPDPIVNTATVSSPTPDPVPGNNAGTGAASLGAPVADLLVTKTDGLTEVVAGTPTTYTITILNRGPSDVPAVPGAP